jgi:hypothetical protein
MVMARSAMQDADALVLDVRRRTYERMTTNIRRVRINTYMQRAWHTYWTLKNMHEAACAG